MRNTKAKQRILDFFEKNNSALTHAFIYNELKEECDRATVYRILERLTSEGILHKIVNVTGIVNYALCFSCNSEHKHTHNHIHFNCENCEEVTCLEDIEPEIKLPKKYKIKEVNLTVSGLCPKCLI
ncbi:MAG: Fur family transcriptional regulator [Bacteroidota bacterium]|jgi:Fur family ferric uptake transcriptional regulator